MIKYNTHLNQYILSIKRLEYIRSWKRINQIQSEDIIFNLQIKHFNKGGLITYLEGIQGFIPKSHIAISINTKNIYLKKRNISCKLLVINEKKNQLILSNKSALLKISKHKFRIGELLYGKVVQIKSYGLFIDIYGVIALLHISEVGFKYISNLSEIFYSNQLVKIKIIHMDIYQGRISLSKRKLI